MNLHREVVDIGRKKLAFRVERAAAPVHAAQIARECDRALHTGRRENPLGPQLLDLRMASILILRGRSPGILRSQPLRYEGRWCKREGLRRRGILALRIAAWNRSLFDAK